MRKISFNELRDIAKQASGQIDKVYCHWTAGHYGQYFDDYHIMIDGDGSVVVSTDDLTEVKAHTWRRNTGAIGISMACCAGATSNDLGDEPPTPVQIENTARVMAVLAEELNLTIDAETMMTHAEAADLDDYGPATTCERWDLAILQTGGLWMDGGNELRGKANYYLNMGLDA